MIVYLNYVKRPIKSKNNCRKIFKIGSIGILLKQLQPKIVLANMKRLSLIILLQILCAWSINAETLRITIFDECDSLPVIGAVATAFAANDSTIIDAAVTNEDGIVILNIDRSKNINYLIKSLGYKPLTPATVNNGDTLMLTPTDNTLAEVTVSATKQTLRRQAGMFVFDPGTLRKESASSLDMLKLTPLLEMGDGSVSILGKGTSTIYINGRDPKMDSNALFEMLKAIPPSQIKRVEIITTPGSKYAASTTGGIVNIVIDNPTEGFIGSLSAQAVYLSSRVSPSASVWGGYSSGRFKLSSSISYKWGDSYSTTLSEYVYTDYNKNISNSSEYKSQTNATSGNINATYDINDCSKIGLSFNFGLKHAHSSSEVKSTTDFEGLSTISKSTISSHSPWAQPRYGIQAYYTLKTDSRGSSLDISADYSINNSRTSTHYDLDNELSDQTTATDSKASHAKATYKYVFPNDNHTINVGYELFNSNVDNDYEYYEQSNDFIYKELINSFFAEWNGSMGENFYVNAGIRVENSSIKGNQTVGAESLKQSYTDIFPTLSLELDLPHGQNLSFDLSRSISRPFYSWLNPFVYWTSATTCKIGNTEINPDYCWDWSLSYSFLNDFVLSAGYRLTLDPACDYTYRNGDITVTSAKNFGSEKNFYSYLSYNHEFGKIWRIKADVSANYASAKASIGDNNVGYKEWTYSFSFYNSFVLSARHHLRATLGYSYYSPQRSVTSNHSSKNLLSASITKRFGSRLTLSLEAANLLNYHNDTYYSSPQYSYSTKAKYSLTSVYFTLNYTIGKLRVKAASNSYNSPLNQRFKSE